MLDTSPKRLPVSDIHAYFGKKKSLVRNLIKMKMRNILCIKFFWEIILRKEMDITFSVKCRPYVMSGLPVNGWFLLLQAIYMYINPLTPN